MSTQDQLATRLRIHLSATEMEAPVGGFVLSPDEARLLLTLLDAAPAEGGAGERERLREAVIWMSGSADFAPGGIARKGFEKIVMPLLTSLAAERERLPQPLFSLEDVQRLRYMQMALGLPEDHYQDIPLAWFLDLADRIESILP